MCANRVLVHSSVIERFAFILNEAVTKTFIHGSVWNESVNFGPLYDRKGVVKAEGHLQDAISKGAKIYSGGQGGSGGPNFFPPTIVVGSSPDMKFLREETFGPIAFLVSFETEDEAVSLANGTDVGLAAYLYTENISRLWRVSEALKVGMVGVRVGLVSAAEMPFGGVRESGLGREGGIDALDEYLDIKAITIGI
jgi:succinate-semialdehyde dehydrogenase/glutarate-semialdehyde dehydrogenase